MSLQSLFVFLMEWDLATFAQLRKCWKLELIFSSGTGMQDWYNVLASWMNHSFESELGCPNWFEKSACSKLPCHVLMNQVR